jgi:hypothetical protein
VRTLIALLLVAGCKGKPALPDPAAFRAMTPEAKCEAVAPRATLCIDELLVADMKDVGLDSSISKQLEGDVRSRRATDDEAEAMHRIRCEGSKPYPDAVIACWTTEPCTAFAECVIRAEHASKP